jgi:acyl-CoA thioesterase FadM
VAETVDGIKFHSRREAKRFRELRVMVRVGEITGLRLQVSFKLVVNGVLVCRYRADFVYVERGVRVVEDCKGFRTREYEIKKRLMRAVWGIEIRET